MKKNNMKYIIITIISWITLFLNHYYNNIFSEFIIGIFFTLGMYHMYDFILQINKG